MRGCDCYLAINVVSKQKDKVECAKDLVDGGGRLITIQRSNKNRFPSKFLKTLGTI